VAAIRANVAKGVLSVVTLSDDFALGTEKSCFRVARPKQSRDQSRALANLHRLGAALRAELIEQPARMSLHRVLADK